MKVLNSHLNHPLSEWDHNDLFLCTGRKSLARKKIPMSPLAAQLGGFYRRRKQCFVVLPYNMIHGLDPIPTFTWFILVAFNSSKNVRSTSLFFFDRPLWCGNR